MAYPSSKVHGPAIRAAFAALTQAVRLAEDREQIIPCAAMPLPKWEALGLREKQRECFTCPILIQCGAMGAADPHATGVWGGYRIPGRQEREAPLEVQGSD